MHSVTMQKPHLEITGQQRWSGDPDDEDGDVYKLLNSSFFLLQSIVGGFLAPRFWWILSLAWATDMPRPRPSATGDCSRAFLTWTQNQRSNIIPALSHYQDCFYFSNILILLKREPWDRWDLVACSGEWLHIATK